MGGELVLVTGGSGFIGGHCILGLLQAGYRVRTTVRSLGREAEVRATLRAAGAQGLDALSFVRPTSSPTKAGPRPPPGATACFTSPLPSRPACRSTRTS